MAETLLYQEKQRTYMAIIMPFVVIALFLIIAIISPETVGFESHYLWRLIIWPVFLILSLGFFFSFMHLSIKITDRYLQLAFGIFRRKFYFDQIKNCFAEEYNMEKYHGYGIRLAKDKSTAFAACAGTGIRLTLVNSQDCFFTTNNQQQILTLIQGKIK